MSAGSKFEDLTTRIISAVVLIILAAVALFTSKITFLVFCALLAGICVWEICKFSNVPTLKAIPTAIAAAFLVAALHLNLLVTTYLCFGLALVTYLALVAQEDKLLRLFYLFLVVLGCWGILTLREENGLIPVIWVVLTVIAADVGGYVFGRLIGGPKLWPAVSPKKTWSGTIGGWVLAIVASVALFLYYDVRLILALASVPVAIAAQAGDLFESWLKRRASIKDSSQLIPGHGGFLDRFDGFIGAGVLIILYNAVQGLLSA
ncbi:MAG: phosphatidate cytidylyltransferase [Pseudomonadota bacterium]